METLNVTYPNFFNGDPTSPKVARVFLSVVLVFVCSVVSFLGIGANIVNIVVFAKQGFKDSINISLLGLAVADLLCAISAFWMSFSCSPLFAKLNLPFHGIDVTYMTAPCIRVSSNRITSLINVFIALERCLCIAIPLKVKLIITPRKTKIIIVSIFISIWAVFSPFYAVHKLEWRFHGNLNKTLLTLVFTNDRELVNSATFMFHSVVLSILCLSSVVGCTLILIIKLNEKSKWRQKSTNPMTSKIDSATVKEQKVVKMITLISIIFILCYLPATVNFTVMCCLQEFSIAGKFKNTYYVVWIVTICLETVNSTVTILVYLKMSSKFRHDFLAMFCCVKKQ